MAQNYELGYGLVRTPSGRITYANGESDEHSQRSNLDWRPLWPNEPQTTAEQVSPWDSTEDEPEVMMPPADYEMYYEPDPPPQLPPAAFISNEPRAMRHPPGHSTLVASRAARTSTGTGPAPQGIPPDFRVPDDSFLHRSFSDAVEAHSQRRSRAASRRSDYSGSTFYPPKSANGHDEYELDSRYQAGNRQRSSHMSRASSRALSRRSSFVSYGEASTQVDEEEFAQPAKSSKKVYTSSGTNATGDPYDLSKDLEEQKNERSEKPKGPPPGVGGPPGSGKPPWLRDDSPADPNVVTWTGKDDPENPMNWKRSKKWRSTILLALMTFSVTFASSVFSTATTQTAAQFKVSTEVMTLATSLFVLGFAFGPIVFGPMSELFGRKIPLFTGFFIFAIFQIAVAVSQNLYTIMICRFFGGLFASAPLAIVGAAMNDFWEPVDRGVAVTVFSSAVFVGPVAGPIAGSFIVTSSLGWRWTEWITAFIAFFFGTIAFFFVPESFAPVLLQRRAKKIKYETKNWAVHAKADENEVNIKRIGDTYLIKPFKMLAQEPILILMTLYMALIYGILYLSFFAYPISFSEKRGWHEGLAALPFCAIIVGVAFAGVLIIFVTKTRFARKMKQTGRVVPEERLVPMFVGGAVLPAGLFWFAWTSNPSISWVPQVLSGIPIGMGLMIIFLQGLNYIIDTYKMNSASAIAANTFARSWVGAGLPLAAQYMYSSLGVPWATSLLGFACVALFPVPILFFIYGARIRAKGKFVPQFPPGGGPPGGKGGPPGAGGGPPGGKGGPPGAGGGPPGGRPAGLTGPPSGTAGPPPGKEAPPPGLGGPPNERSGGPTEIGGPPPGKGETSSDRTPLEKQPPMANGAGGPPPGAGGRPVLTRPPSNSPTALPQFPATAKHAE